MTKNEFDKFFNEKLDELKKLRDTKHSEYATNDETFLNLIEGARKLDVHSIRYAFILMTKQYNSMDNYSREWSAHFNSSASFDVAWEKTRDIIIYNMLMLGLWREYLDNNVLTREDWQRYNLCKDYSATLTRKLQPVESSSDASDWKRIPVEHENKGIRTPVVNGFGVSGTRVIRGERDDSCISERASNVNAWASKHLTKYLEELYENERVDGHRVIHFQKGALHPKHLTIVDDKDAEFLEKYKDAWSKHVGDSDDMRHIDGLELTLHHKFSWTDANEWHIDSSYVESVAVNKSVGAIVLNFEAVLLFQYNESSKRWYGTLIRDRKMISDERLVCDGKGLTGLIRRALIVLEEEKSNDDGC